MIIHRLEVQPIRGSFQLERIINRRVLYVGWFSLTTDWQVRITFQPTDWRFNLYDHLRNWCSQSFWIMERIQRPLKSISAYGFTYDETTSKYVPFTEISLKYFKPLAPSSRSISVTSGVDPWYDTNLNGWYFYFETYRSLPVYKVSFQTIDYHWIRFILLIPIFQTWKMWFLARFSNWSREWHLSLQCH